MGQPHPRATPRPRRGGSRCSKAPPVGHNPFRPRHVFHARVLPGTRCQELVGGGGRRRHLPCVPTPASESQRVWSQAPFHSWRPGRHGRDRGSARQWASHDGRDRDGLTWTRVVPLPRVRALAVERMRDGCPRSVHTTAAVARIPIALHTIPRAHTRGERARPAECPSRIAGGGRYCPDPWRRRKLCVASVFFPSLCEPHGRREATQDGSLRGSLVPGATAAVVRMSAFLVTTGPAASLTALLTMSGTAPRCSSPPGWVGAINDPEGGDASAQKLTIGYLLCDEEDHHHPPRGRPVSAGAGRPVAEDVTSQRLDVVEQRRAAGVPRQPPAADRRPALSRDDEGADRSRAGERLAGHVSSRGTHDEREARPCPPTPRHAVPAGQEEHVARLSIPPLRLPPGDRQGGRPTPTGGSIEWPRVPARQMGRLGDDPQQWSPMAPWAGPLVSRDGRPVRLPPVPSSNPSADTWSGHRGDSAQRPVPADQRAPPHEAPPVRLGKATGRGPKCPSDPAPLGEAPRAAGYRQRPLPALWRPQSPSAEEGPPSSVGSRTAGPDLPRQRPYVPVEGRVARAAPWQRSMGGVGGGAGLPYPPLRALRTAGRGLSNVFHSGLPPLLPPSSTSLSLADLQRPSPSGAPLTHRLDHSDADKASTDGAAKGVHAAASPLDPLRRPCHPEGDIKGGVPDKERSNQPLQLQLVNTNGASRSPVKAEAQPGAGGVIYPSDKAELGPVRLVLGTFTEQCVPISFAVSWIGPSSSLHPVRAAEMSFWRCRWAPPSATSWDWSCRHDSTLTWTVLDPSWQLTGFMVVVMLMCVLVSDRSQRRRTRARSATSASLIEVSCSPTSVTCTRGRGGRLSASAAVLVFGNAHTNRSTSQLFTSRRSRTLARSACTALGAAVICT